MLASDLKTVQLVPLTAFDAQGELNLEPMRAQTERLIDAGIKVLIPCAGSSEFHNLVADEIIESVKMTCEVAQGRARVITPVGLQLPYAMELACRARELGSDGLLVMPLDFPYVSDAGARDYYLALLEQIAMPTVIYKKGAVPSDALLLELADHPAMVGVKYSVNDLSQFQATVAADRSRIDWFCGSAERFAPYFFLAGASGYTSGAGNLCPRLTRSLLDALVQGDYPKAMQIQRLIAPIEYYRARENNAYNVTFLKYAVSHLGFDFGDPRPPYRRLTKAEREEIDQIVLPILELEQSMSLSEREIV